MVDQIRNDKGKEAAGNTRSMYVRAKEGVLKGLGLCSARAWAYVEDD